jgi:ribonuclease M5
MSEKLKIKEAIVVEGRYDKNTLSQIVDAVIIETKGFAVFNDSEIMRLISFYADRCGLIILTDSDGAGFMIRNRIKSSISPDKLKQAYIPDICGKEKRKKKASSENKLGVEGMTPEVIINSLLRAGATVEASETQNNSEAQINKPALYTKADFYAMGFSGRPDSAARRAEVLKALNLPEKLGADGLLDAVNTLLSEGMPLEAILEAHGKNHSEKQQRKGKR